MATLRFLQFSDLHFGNQDYEHQWECPREKVEIIESETREVVERIVKLAKDREVEAVLIPGNLFDARTISLEGIRFLQDCFQSLGETPVFVAPGNEDFYGSSGFYNSQFLTEIGMNPWPSNVHIFGEKAASGIIFPGNEHIAITGIPHLGRGLKKVKPLASPIAKDAMRLNILAFHGTWEKNGALDQWATLPFNTEELYSHHFDYAAFGHTHSGEEITDEEGKVRGAASGCPYGRRTDELGEKTIIVGEVERGGIRPENIERIPVAPRTVREVRIQCRGSDKIQSLGQRIEKALHRGKIEATDLVLIRLEGEGNHELLQKVYEYSVREMYFLAKMDTSAIKTKFDFKRYGQGIDSELTTEGLFARRMRELLNNAENPREQRTVEKALEWGLEALTNKRIEFDHENQGI